MLHLKGITQSASEAMESDFYIPIKVKFGDWDARKEPHVFLGIGNNKMLLEIGLGQKTGSIGVITLILSPTIELRERHKELDEISTKNGLPLFSTKRWTDTFYYLKDQTTFSVYLEDDCIIIELVNHKVESKVINGRFAFGFDRDNLLCTIEFKDIKEDEKSTLKESLGLNKSLD